MSGEPTRPTAAMAGTALKGAVRLSNEILGTARLLEMGLPVTPGIIRAMRRYLRAVEGYVDALEGKP